MTEEYLPIPEGYCPSCYSPIGAWNKRDPILTPKGFSGDKYIGIQKITTYDMKSLMDYWSHVGGMAGTWGNLDIKDMLFYNNNPVLIKINKNHIIYLRGLVESILDTLGWSLNQYFNWTKDGYLVRNTKSTWSDILDINNNFKMKAQFIEELRQGMLMIWREPWNKENFILYVDGAYEWVTEYHTDILEGTHTEGRILNNHWWAFYFSSYKNTTIAGDLAEEKWNIKIQTEEPSDLYVGASSYFEPELEYNIRNGKLNGFYSPTLKIGDRDLVSKLGINITNKIVTSERLCDKNHDLVRYNPDSMDIVEKDIELLAAFVMIKATYTIIPVDYEGLYIDYTPENSKILTYYSTEEEITDPTNPYNSSLVVYDPDMKKFLHKNDFVENLCLTQDFVDLFDINPSEWKLVRCVITIMSDGDRREVDVWGGWYGSSAPYLRYVDQYYSKNSVNVDCTLEKCFIYYDLDGNYITQNLSSQIDGEQGVFELENTPIASSIILKLNGVELKQGSVEEPKDYFVAGNEVILTTLPSKGSNLEIEYLSES